LFGVFFLAQQDFPFLMSSSTSI